jgi:hypothetical protein
MQRPTLGYFLNGVLIAKGFDGIMSKDAAQNSPKETRRRLQNILQGAFVGSPTPLKDIPKKDGESRSLEKLKKKKRKHAVR